MLLKKITRLLDNKQMSKSSENTLFWIFAVSLVLFFGLWLLQCINLITSPFPTEYRDWGGIDLTNEYIKQAAPYEFSSAPFFFIYGFVFSWLIYLIESVTHIDVYLLTKVIVFICVILAAAMLAIECNALTRSTFLATLGFCLMLWSSWNQGVFFILRPDSFALLLVLLILLSIRRSKNYFVLACSAVGCVLIFYTKSYFLYILPAIIFYLYLSNGLKSSIFFTIIFLALLALSAIRVTSVYPTYFYASILAQSNAIGGSWAYSLKQFTKFSIWYWPLLALVAYCAIKKLTALITISPKKVAIFHAVRNQLLKQDTTIYMLVFLTGLICLIPMGKNYGAYLNYHYQLILPSLIILGLVALSRIDSTFKRIGMIFLIIFFCLFHGRLMHQILYNKNSVINWKVAREIILTHENRSILIATPILAGISSSKSTLILDNGHSECYTGLKINSNSPAYLSLFFPKSESYFQSFAKFYESVSQKIMARKYELIVVTKNYHPMISQDLLVSNYTKIKEINLQAGSINWATEFWTPKNN